MLHAGGTGCGFRAAQAALRRNTSAPVCLRRRASAREALAIAMPCTMHGSVGPVSSVLTGCSFRNMYMIRNIQESLPCNLWEAKEQRQ